jgi:stage II sporulation protein D
LLHILGWHPEMRRLPLLTALFACLAAPAAAGAATVYVVKGGGFGHGVGMSQYGAQGFALHGWSYRRILTHYYRHTRIGRASTRNVRVLLRSGGGGVYVGHVSRAGSKRLNPNAQYAARVRSGRIELRGPGGHRVARGHRLRLRGPHGYTRMGGNYRGVMELRPNGGSVMAINIVSLDAYVQGVIPGEMPSGWRPEALKVQAVAARSFALATDRGGGLFDQYSDTRSQVYLGMGAEQRSTNAAARATAGQVVLYHGRVATTYYSSGGRTENVENVFYGSPHTPYLRGVKDPYDGISPRHRWQVRFSAASLDARLRNQCPGSFRRIRILKRGYSPRVVRAQVVCSRGRVRASGQTLRSELGLYDSWFTVTRASSKASRKSAAAVNVPLLSALVHPRSISGSFDPLPSHGYVDVERLDGGHWVLVARGLTNRLGQYSVPVYEPGTYRVIADGVSAPSVGVR